MTADAINRCPCCGQAVPVTPDLVVSLDYNSAVRGGVMFTMQPQEAVMLRELHRVWPRSATIDQLESALYGIDEAPIDAYRMIRVRACNLRKPLRTMGLTIKSEYGVGYRLAELTT